MIHYCRYCYGICSRGYLGGLHCHEGPSRYVDRWYHICILSWYDKAPKLSKAIIYQVVSGVKHLHSLSINHGNLEPAVSLSQIDPRLMSFNKKLEYPSYVQKPDDYQTWWLWLCVWKQRRHHSMFDISLIRLADYVMPTWSFSMCLVTLSFRHLKS